MRLICGLLRLDGAAAARAELDSMARAMIAPGLSPEIALCCDGPVGLATLDFGSHPAGLAASAASLFAGDVRLDEPPGAASGSDDSALLAMLERDGAAALGDVHGDFAFAHWDRATAVLVCGRDALGIRPLSYVHRPGALFAFASFPKAFHAAGLVPETIDRQALLHRMWLSWSAEESLIAGVKRLPPAHLLTVSGAGLGVTRYWQPRPAKSGLSYDQAVGVMRRLVEQAVRTRLRGARAVGAHLSGGLDSSALAVLAARALRQEGRRLFAYSFLDRLRNEAAPEDSAALVRAVLDQEGDIDWTPLRPAHAVLALEAPSDAATMASLAEDDPDNACLAAAHRQGVERMLSGWGGDEAATFRGAGALAELLRSGRLRKLGREVRAARRERGRGTAHVLYGDVVAPLLPQPLVAAAKKALGREASVTEIFRSFVRPEARPRKPPAPELTAAADGLAHRLRYVTSPHISDRTEAYAARGAAAGIAFAFPLLDRRVVEFALSLPSEYFLRDGFQRSVFRDAMSGVLPEVLRGRHEKDRPFPSALLDLAEGKDRLGELIDAYERVPEIDRVFDLARLRAAVARFPAPETVRDALLAGRDPPGTSDIVAVRLAVSVAEYLTQHHVADG